MARQINGRRALITGASSGIGWELAVQLAAEGVHVLGTSRRKARLDALRERILGAGGKCDIVAGDIAQSDIRELLVAHCRSMLGGLDFLINCAGVGAVGAFGDASTDRLQRIFEVNFFAPVELTRACLPLLRQGSQALIVNISSVLGHRAVPYKSEYCATKFALHGFSDALRAELKDEGIGVLLVSPATTDSEFFDSVLENRLGDDLKASTPASPEWVARATLRAMRRGKHEVILSAGGKALVWFDRLFPRWADSLVARFFKPS